MEDRFKGIMTKHTLRHRTAVNVMDSARCGAFEQRKGGDKMEPMLTGGREHSAQLASDISPQAGVCFFIDAGDAQLHRPGNNPVNCQISLIRPHVPGLCVKDQHLGLAICPRKKRLFLPNSDQDIFRLELCAGIYGSGKVVCNDQQLHENTSFECFKMKHENFLCRLKWLF